MLMIRLKRVGRRNDPSFRLVAVDRSRGPKSNKIVEQLGFYNPKTKERQINDERVKYWIGVGAQTSGTVHNMLIDAGVMEGEKKNVLPRKSPVVKEADTEEAKGDEVPSEVEGEQEAETSSEGESEQDDSAGTEEEPSTDKEEQAEQEATAEEKTGTSDEASKEEKEDPKAESEDSARAGEESSADKAPEGSSSKGDSNPDTPDEPDESSQEEKSEEQEEEGPKTETKES